MSDRPVSPLRSADAVGATSKRDLFPPTSWSLLARAANPDTVAPAVNDFAELYDNAVRLFILSIVRDREQAQELTQQFFLKVVLPGRLFDKANHTKGRFRDFLKQSIRNFLIDEHRRRTRQKRKGDVEALRPDGFKGGWDAVALESLPAHDAAFLRGWAQSLVRAALARVWIVCQDKKQEQHFRVFEARYFSPAEMPSWNDVGEPFGLDGKKARERGETVARHFRVVVRDLIGLDPDSEEQVDEAILELLSLF
jgi:RNA polymerase sigma factor (sigma-70 family)